MPLTTGTRLGPFEVTAQIGAGGMGEVYRARDPRLDRDVAVKVLRAEVVGDSDRRARFVLEAKAVSALNHPNIVTVHDIGTEGDRVYFVMELVDGRPLDELVRPGGMRVPDVLRIGAQIADAFERAHAQQIIHRDLKPANVMVQRDGRVKVLDFGLAKLIGGSENGASDATKTAEGMIVGTAAYMSPEQAEGKPLDTRTDIFALGAVLYELCAGKRAFTGDSSASVIASILKEEPASLAVARPDLPPELARLIMRCLRKDPSKRVQSMADLKVALEELKDDLDSGRMSGPMAAAPSASRSSTKRWVATAVVVVLLGGGAALYFRPRAATPADPSASPMPTPFTSYPGDESGGSFSPDGNQFVFSWNGEKGDNDDIYVKLVNGDTPLRLTTDPRSDSGPRWSPDGQHIAFLRWLGNNTFAVMMISPLGGVERTLAQLHSTLLIGTFLSTLAWAPDSKSLFVSGAERSGEPNHILGLSVETGTVRQLLAADPKDFGYAFLAISPDGRSLATVYQGGPGRRLDTIALSPAFECGAVTHLASVPNSVGRMTWMGDSRTIVYGIGVNSPQSLYRVSVTGGAPESLSWTGPGAMGPVISMDGKRLVFTRAARDANIWRVPLDHSGTPDIILQSSFREVAPQYSPDGTRLAFYSNRSGSVQIWTASADGSGPTQLTSMEALSTTGTPRWSPDGQQISFDSNASGRYQIYVLSADGGKPRPITTDGVNFVSCWSPDGQWIYFTSDRTGGHEVWRTSVDGRNTEKVTSAGGEAPLFSNDGAWLYYTKRDGADGLWRMPAKGGSETRVVEAIFRYNFATTASGVYFEPPAANNGLTTVRYKDFRTGAVRDVHALTKPVDLGLAVSPDGHYLLFCQLDYAGSDLMIVQNFR